MHPDERRTVLELARQVTNDRWLIVHASDPPCFAAQVDGVWRWVEARRDAHTFVSEAEALRVLRRQFAKYDKAYVAHATTLAAAHQPR